MISDRSVEGNGVFSRECLSYFELCFLVFISVYNHLTTYQQYFEPFVPLQLTRETISERMRALQVHMPAIGGISASMVWSHDVLRK
jgi:hypothetical protein